MWVSQFSKKTQQSNKSPQHRKQTLIKLKGNTSWLCGVIPVVCGASLVVQGAILVVCGASLAVQGCSCPAAREILSFPTKDQTHDPCVGRQILNHWATGEVPEYVLK